MKRNHLGKAVVFHMFFVCFTLGYLPERHEQDRPIRWFRPWGSNRGSLQAIGNDKKDKKDLTWWLIPLSKWVITPIISGFTLLIPFITGVITHLLSGMSHQVVSLKYDEVVNDYMVNRYITPLYSRIIIPHYIINMMKLVSLFFGDRDLLRSPNGTSTNL